MIFTININRIFKKFNTFFLIFFFNLYNLFSSKKRLYNEDVCFIIFSKDRSIQLHALLSSLLYYVSGEFKIHILYSTEEKYNYSYNELIEEFKENKHIDFFKQGSSFKDDLIAIVNGTNADKIFFLVDDIIFKKRINLSVLNLINLNKQVFSLRHGLHLNYSYVVSKNQNTPPYCIKQNMIHWRWNEGELDWRYPLSVDGHLFKSEAVRFWVKSLIYNSPNTFEMALQVFNCKYLKMEGICLNESIIFNNPCNKVQADIENLHGGLHQSELLAKWNAGYKIDFLKFENLKNESVHQEEEFYLLKR